MLVAQHPPATGQGLLVELTGALQVAQGLAGGGQVAHRGQSVGVVVTQHLPPCGQSLLEQLAGALQV